MDRETAGSAARLTWVRAAGLAAVSLVAVSADGRRGIGPNARPARAVNTGMKPGMDK